jgi:hypothetical protein
MKCRICNSETTEQFSAIVLSKHTVRYFLCNRCFFLQTEEPYWLDEAYRNSINNSDTGVVARSIFFSKIVTSLICLRLERDGRFLDYGGGYGLFTRLMRDVGFDYYWSDPFTQNLFAKGFEFDSRYGEFELITCFETFEHFTDPMRELTSMMKFSSNIFLSTELLPIPIPSPSEWYYYAPEHGQHVSFYSSRTFRHIAGQLGLTYHTNGSDLHFLTKRKISAVTFRIIIQYGKFLYLALKKQMKSRTTADSITTAKIQGS